MGGATNKKGSAIQSIQHSKSTHLKHKNSCTVSLLRHNFHCRKHSKKPGKLPITCTITTDCSRLLTGNERNTIAHSLFYPFFQSSSKKGKLICFYNLR